MQSNFCMQYYIARLLTSRYTQELNLQTGTLYATIPDRTAPAESQQDWRFGEVLQCLTDGIPVDSRDQVNVVRTVFTVGSSCH